MRHAFLIIAHNNWMQLDQLIHALSAENHDIYIHVDKKNVNFREDYFSNIDKSRTHFFQEYKVFWGGDSIVKVELFLFEQAFKQNYDYYHVISGMDFPLKNNREIDEFFEKNNGIEFIQFNDDKANTDPDISRRTKYYHLFQNYRRRYMKKWKNGLFTFCERVLLVLQMILHIDRTRKLNWVIKYGSQWVSVTNSFVEELLKQEEKIKKVFSYTSCSDELFIQTVAYNCGFESRIYTPEIGMAQNVRLIDWKRGKNGNPYTFRKCDEQLLLADKNLFARKFSETVDSDIIDIVYNTLQKRKEQSD